MTPKEKKFPILASSMDILESWSLWYSYGDKELLFNMFEFEIDKRREKFYIKMRVIYGKL